MQHHICFHNCFFFLNLKIDLFDCDTEMIDSGSVAKVCEVVYEWMISTMVNNLIEYLVGIVAYVSWKLLCHKIKDKI